MKEARNHGALPWLRPDTKTQVTIEYEQDGGAVNSKEGGHFGHSVLNTIGEKGRQQKFAHSIPTHTSPVLYIERDKNPAGGDAGVHSFRAKRREILVRMILAGSSELFWGS